MVLHEEHQVKSNSGRSKSKKPKKIPQRGLGVAQLEKLRIEEQQKNNNSSASTSSSSSNPLANLILRPTPPKQPPLSIMCSTDSTYMVDPNSITFSPSSFPLHGTKGIDPIETEMAGNFNFHFIAPPSSASTHDPQINHPQIRNQYNQQKPMVTLVNKTILPLSSGVNLQIEPPSNQIYSNYIRPSWTEGERIVSTNPSSWSIIMPDFTSFPRRNLPVPGSFLKLGESLPTYGNEAMKFESRNSGFREDSSSSITHQVDWRNSEFHINKRLRESNYPSPLDSSFLSLGSSLVQSISRSNPQHCEHPEVFLLQSQFTQRGANCELLRSEEALRQPLYNFFPLAPSTTCEAACKDEGNVGFDGVDTNLKL